DASGHFMGLATADPSARFLVAGIAPARAHELTGRNAVAALLKQAGLNPQNAAAGPAVTTGAIAERVRSQLVSIACES
ncbi:MAG: hypothetical protein ACRCWO_03355, partial [Bosea sp. (in: a-proteobacteria)]